MNKKIMKENLLKIKEKLANHIPTIGTWVQIGHNNSTEILSSSDSFDWVCIDLEHSAISIEKCESLIRAIEYGGSVPIVRLTSNNSDLIKRVMDSGALGIVVPMVSSLKDVTQAFDAMHFPPMGNRGVGLARAQEWGNSFEFYKNEVDPNTLFIGQIEHIDAVKNIDEIFESGLLDAYLIGPYDLSASLGKPGEFNDNEFISALESIKKAAVKHKVIAGYHLIEPDTNQLDQLIADGYIFIAYSIDSVILREAVKLNR